MSGTIAEMRAAVARLETTLQETKARLSTPAELREAELEALRAWKIASMQRHIRPASVKP